MSVYAQLDNCLIGRQTLCTLGSWPLHRENGSDRQQVRLDNVGWRGKLGQVPGYRMQVAYTRPVARLAAVIG